MLYSAGLDVRLRQRSPRMRDVIGWLFSDDVTCPRAAILRRVLHPGNCDVLSRRSYRDDLSPRVFLANFPPVETELSATTFRASRSTAWTCSPSTTTRSLRTATTATPCRSPGPATGAETTACYCTIAGDQKCSIGATGHGSA